MAGASPSGPPRGRGRYERSPNLEAVLQGPPEHGSDRPHDERAGVRRGFGNFAGHQRTSRQTAYAMEQYNMNGYSRIVRVVVAHTGIDRAYIMGRCREVPVSHARALAMYLAYHICKHATSTTVGMYFDRDHTTVLKAINKIDAAIQACEEFAESVRQLRQGLEA